MKAGGEGFRDEIIIPDSAHGTNPASAAVRLQVVEVASNERGSVCVDALREVVGAKTAGSYAD